MQICLVTYRLGLAVPSSEVTALTEFSAPSNYKDPLKIEEYINTQKNKFLENAQMYPFVGTVSEVQLVDLAQSSLSSYVTGAVKSTTKKLNYLHRRAQKANDKLVLVGYEIRAFLRVLASAAAAARAPLSPEIWLNNDNHLDVDRALLDPSNLKNTSPALKALGFVQQNDKTWSHPELKNGEFQGWRGFGFDAAQDSLALSHIAACLGLLDGPSTAAD